MSTAKLRFLAIHLLLFSGVWAPSVSRATHIVGAEMYYTYLGNDNYRVFLRVFRDCGPSNVNGTGFDNQAGVGIYTAGNTLFATLQFQLTQALVETIPVTLDNPCFTLPQNVCIQSATYSQVVNLPFNSAGYTISYQRCCYNNTVSNINFADQTGITATVFVPGSNLITTRNSSAVFDRPSPAAMCLGAEFFYDCAATDPDGDHLVYSFCDPFQGGTVNYPTPFPPPAPPYTPVSWASGYSSAYPIASSPAFTIDSQTGYMTGTANQLGLFLVGICISEYRAGVLIASHSRVFQYRVTMCNPNIVAVIPEQTSFCEGPLVTFENASQNAQFFHWDFGVEGIDSDTSDLQNPSFLYPEAGEYTIMLIANPGWPCADTAYQDIVAMPFIEPEIGIGSMECINNLEVYDFSASGTTSPGAQYHWDFGPGAVPQYSNTQYPQNISLPHPSAQQSIVLSVTDYGCTETDSETMTLPERPVAVIVDPDNVCNGLSFTFSHLSVGHDSVLWDFGTGNPLDISYADNASVNFPGGGIYLVSLTAMAEYTCPNTSQLTVEAIPLFNASIEVGDFECLNNRGVFDFYAVSSAPETALYEWNFGPGSDPEFSQNRNPENIYLNDEAAGHIIQLTITDNGCDESASVLIDNPPEPEAVILGQETECTGLTYTFNSQSLHAESWDWDFGDPLSTAHSFEENPTHTFSGPGSYPVELIVSSEFTCPDTMTYWMEISDVPEPYFERPAPQCLSVNSFDFTPSGLTPGSTCVWEFGPLASPESAIEPNVGGVTFSEAGHFPVTVTMRNQQCIVSFTDTVWVVADPILDVSIEAVAGCPGLSVGFEATSVSETPVFYSWEFGDGTSSNDQHPSHVYENPGFYDVTVSAFTNAGCWATISETFDNAVTVYANPLPGFVVTPQEVTIFDPAVTVISAAENGIRCHYELSDFTTVESCDFEHIWESSGTMTITQYVWNEAGCVASVSGEVLVTGHNFFAPNSFSPDGDGINDVWMPVVVGATRYTLQVRDRWGTLVFSSEDPKEAWVGGRDGASHFAPDGVYAYQAVVWDSLQRPYDYHGHIVLVR